MFNLLKAVCLAVYALGLAGLAGWLPGVWSTAMQLLAAATLLVHALELVFVVKYVRLYRGSLATSVALTLLFGLLHWKPLADAAHAHKSARPTVSSQ